MCGIYGELTTRANADARARFVEAARARLRHRGPDGAGTFRDEHCLIGHTRLKIVDLSEAAAQPMVSASKRTVLAHNGEIYNFAELRSQLRAPSSSWRSTGDTEVLLELLEQHGLEGLPRTLGMFACAVWRPTERELWLVRDYLGQKPMFWTRLSDGSIRFASEVGALLADGVVERRTSTAQIAEFLQYTYNLGPRSSFAGIHSVPPGHALRFKIDGARIERSSFRYWKLPDHSADDVDQEAQWLDELSSLLDDAVRLRLRSDVPLGAYLSGGTDSAVVAAIARRHVGDGLRTLTVDFPARELSERKDAAQTATHLDTDHREVLLTTPNADVFEDVIALTGELHGNVSFVAQLAAARAMRERATVCLTGNGGDELLAGYTRYGLALRDRSDTRRRARMVRALAARYPIWTRGDSRLVGRYGDVVATYEAMMQQYPGRETPPLFVVPPRITPEPVADALLRHAGRPPLFRLLATDLDTYLPGDIHVLLDRSSMSASLELRSPFLDHRLHEHVTRARPEWLVDREGRPKRPLRTLFRDQLPAGLFDRPKRGFGVPVNAWLRSPALDRRLDDLVESTSGIHDVVDRRVVRRLVRGFRLRTHAHGNRLWTLLLLDAWFRRWRPRIVADDAVRE